MLAAVIKNILNNLIDGVVYIIEIMIDLLTVLFALIRRLLNALSKLVPSLPPRIGESFPESIKASLTQKMKYAGIEGDTETILGYITIYSIFLGLILTGVAGIVTRDLSTSLGGFIAGMVIGGITAFASISIIIDRRSSNIELVLPDFLSLMSQNIAAGMTTYDAMRSSIRPEFGPLSDEINQVSRDMFSGIPMETALLRMTNRVKSERIDRVIRLIIAGLKSGGQLPRVLQEISQDLQREQGLMKRMSAETFAQIAFTILGVVFGAPLLFAVSIQFIELFQTIFDEIKKAGVEEMSTEGSMVSIQAMGIEPQLFFFYAVGMLFILSFFGGLVMGLLRNGKVLTGANVVFVPVLVLASLGVFFLLRYVISKIFSEMFVGI